MRKIKDLGETIFWGLLLVVATAGDWFKKRQVLQIVLIVCLAAVVVWVAIANIVRDQKIGLDNYSSSPRFIQPPPSYDEFQKTPPMKSQEFLKEEKKRQEEWTLLQKNIREGKVPPPREEDGGVMSVLK